MRLSKSRSSSSVFPSTSAADFSSQRAIVYTERQRPMPLLITAPRSNCPRNLAGTAIRPFASIVCSYSPRNILLALLSRMQALRWPLPDAQDVLPHPARPLLPTPPARLAISPSSSPKFPTSPHSIIALIGLRRKGYFPPVFARTRG